MLSYRTSTCGALKPFAPCACVMVRHDSGLHTEEGLAPWTRMVLPMAGESYRFSQQEKLSDVFDYYSKIYL